MIWSDLNDSMTESWVDKWIENTETCDLPLEGAPCPLEGAVAAPWPRDYTNIAIYQKHLDISPNLEIKQLSHNEYPVYTDIIVGRY